MLSLPVLVRNTIPAKATSAMDSMLQRWVQTAVTAALVEMRWLLISLRIMVPGNVNDVRYHNGILLCMLWRTHNTKLNVAAEEGLKYWRYCYGPIVNYDVECVGS